MYKKLNNIIGKLLLLTLFLVSSQSVHAKIVFESEFLLENSGSNWVIDSQDDVSGNVSLQFGNTLGKTITFNTGNSWFEINDDLNLDQNQLKNVVIDNLAAAPGAPVAGQIYHNTVDGNTYVWSGSAWEDITAVSSTSSKVVTVGTGLDYATIADAASYLNSLSGGIILLSAESHSVTTAVNLTNITLIGKDASKTTIIMSGAGQFDSFDTRFVYLTLDINSITATYAIDVQTGSSSLQFEWVDFDVQDGGDSLIDSSAGAPPTSTITFENCSETAGAGNALKSKAGGNLNVASSIFVSSASGNSLLQINDWDVTIEGSGNVNTSGMISTIPDNTIFVYPGMNLQGAINSLTGGGSITILPGTHSITSSLMVTNDNIEISGYGEASIISASGFVSTGDTIGAIQVGSTDGTSPADGVVLKDFKLNVSSNIHGIRVAGGTDNQIYNVSVQKLAGQGGTGATADIGIQLLDGTAEQLVRPVVRNSAISGNGGTNYFTDGIHVTSDGTLSGVWGNGQGVINALIEGNSVDYVRETGYAFVGVNDSSLFNNRASRMGASTTGGYGIYMGNLVNINMNANVFSRSLSTNATAIGIDSGGTGTSTVDSIFNNNIINGIDGGGLGFTTGFQINNGSNQVHRNSFQGNTIRGAAVATTVAIDINGDSDDNTFSDNGITGGTNAWDTGIVLDNATQERNLIRDNRFSNTTVVFIDSGTGTTVGVAHHRATSNPTINDDNADGYRVGMIWVNTTNDTSYISVDDTVGAAVWKQIDASGGSSDFEAVYATDADKILTTGNGAFSIAAGSGVVSANSTGGINLNNNTNGNLNLATGTSTGTINLGGGSSPIGVNSTTWDISTAGAATGFTGITSTGVVNFSGASRLALRQGSSNPATCTEGDIFYNTTTDYAQLCTATNVWTPQGRRVPDLHAFSDTTADTIINFNDTTDYWDGTRPNITPIATTSEVLVMVTVSWNSNTTGDESSVFRVERSNNGLNPVCGISTKIGEELGFFQSDPDDGGSSAIFVDAPSSTNNVRYTLCSDSDSTDGGGTIDRIDFTLYEINNAADLAEVYATNDINIKPGDVVSMDSNLSAGVKKTTKAYDKKVIGVVSTQPAKTIGGTGGEGKTGVPVALTGRAPVKVSTENGPIQPGDLLTPSSIPGVAMKATKPSYVIGRAFGSYDQKGIGLVMTFLNTHFADPSSIEE